MEREGQSEIFNIRVWNILKLPCLSSTSRWQPQVYSCVPGHSFSVPGFPCVLSILDKSPYPVSWKARTGTCSSPSLTFPRSISHQLSLLPKVISNLSLWLHLTTTTQFKLSLHSPKKVTRAFCGRQFNASPKMSISSSSEPCHFTQQNKFANVMVLRVLRWEDYPGLSTWTTCYHRFL